MGQWVGQQRYFYRRRMKGETTSLTEERINALNELGFEWKARGAATGPKHSLTVKAAEMASFVEEDKGISLLAKQLDHATTDNAQKCTDESGGSVMTAAVTSVVEKDNEINLPDGTFDCASKEVTQKRMILLRDGCEALETTSKTYTTKIERVVITEEEPPAAGDESGQRREIKEGILQAGAPGVASPTAARLDGRTVVCSTEVSWRKRVVRLADGTRLLETTTTTCTTKIERCRLPPEEEEEAESDEATTQSDRILPDEGQTELVVNL